MRRRKRIVPAALALSVAFSMAAAPAAFASVKTSNTENGELEPGNPYDAATTATLQDNVLEYDEIELLIDAYNKTLKSNRETYQDQKDSVDKDIAKIKEQILESAGELTDTASTLSGTAGQFEDLLGTSIAADYGVTPAAYAQMVYSAETLSYQAEQVALSADAQTQVTPQMLRLQLVDMTRAALVSGAQSAMIGYEQILLQKDSLNDSIGLLEAVLKATEAQASLGMATQNDVISARQNLDSAKAGLLTIDISEQKIRQSLCTMLGWEYSDTPEIQKVPDPDMSRIAQMNPENDKQAAIDNNFTLQYNVMSRETMDQGSVTMQNLDRTIEQEKAEIASSLTNLYNDVLQKKSEYDTAVAALELEQTKMDAADRKLAVQTISQLEYRQQQNSYKTKQVAVDNAKLALFQSMETYDWAVKGNLSL